MFRQHTRLGLRPHVYEAPMTYMTYMTYTIPAIDCFYGHAVQALEVHQLANDCLAVEADALCVCVCVCVCACVC